MEARDLRKLPVDEYVALDRSDDARWEYAGGEAFAMSGASPAHNVVVDNVIAALKRLLHGRPCLPMSNGQKIATAATQGYHYPDAMVVCGKPVLDPIDEHAIANPTVLVEVLSPTTTDYSSPAPGAARGFAPAARPAARAAAPPAEAAHASPGAFDRGGKFAHYRTLESLREYVVLSLEPRLVEHHRRIEPGKWLLTEIAGKPIELESVGVTLAWDELWTDLDRLA